ncbi:UNVERIFIED_CONTAM: Uridine-cytidine kinase C [Sesamum indicum]
MDGVVTVGIGGPSGSGKSSLAEKVASVIGCTVISMENYCTGVDDGHDLDSIDFDLLVQNLVDIGDSCSLDYLIDSIFPLFIKHIEPDLHHAQIRINNSFVSSFREPIYKLKCKSELQSQSGLAAYTFRGKETQVDKSSNKRLDQGAPIWYQYYLSLGDQRIVDKNYIIRPRAEFEVGRMTLGGLLALGYTVVVSYKRASTSSISSVDSWYGIIKAGHHWTVDHKIISRDDP